MQILEEAKQEVHPQLREMAGYGMHLKYNISGGFGGNGRGGRGGRGRGGFRGGNNRGFSGSRYDPYGRR